MLLLSSSSRAPPARVQDGDGESTRSLARPGSSCLQPFFVCAVQLCSMATCSLATVKTLPSRSIVRHPGALRGLESSPTALDECATNGVKRPIDFICPHLALRGTV
ncbi:hypothetical protein EXIGLDRAFT_336732 [Exidia glandulosa HHB12029]|uniref:Uncharacterized protein n=1 Tax=Exidia glandulosa HHB12029 TaxID=1314781 RepID=A0A165ZGW7_EXIGL|nr:hypothetical protein EXIGLDRAFT_336732 [Exidia glandulosa HHB12029]